MSAKYGKGSNETNPFFPGETMYEGSDKSIVSPHGSIFNVEVSTHSTMDERLKGKGGKLPGKTTSNASAPARKSKRGGK